MNKEYRSRTDLAYEEVESLEIDGVKQSEYIHKDVKIHKTVVEEMGSKQLNKKPGIYYTVDCSDYFLTNYNSYDDLEEVLIETLKTMFKELNIGEKSSCLVVGLGNEKITPDSLGPAVVNNIFVTSHLFALQPENIQKGFRKVSSLIPRVMGDTGIETFEIVDAITKRIKPDFLIVIDALAARNIQRVNQTIQLTNTGIHPGSGVGNSRKEISTETLGIPVIAIGVPTVVDAVTITSDTIDLLVKYLNHEFDAGKKELLVTSNMKDIDYTKEVDMERKQQFLGHLGVLSEDEKREVIYEALTPTGYNMIVTPKEVDENIENLCLVISNSLDKALHRDFR